MVAIFAVATNPQAEYSVYVPGITPGRRDNPVSSATLCPRCAEWIRTSDLRVNSSLLCQAELQHIDFPACASNYDHHLNRRIFNTLCTRLGGVCLASATEVLTELSQRLG